MTTATKIALGALLIGAIAVGGYYYQADTSMPQENEQVSTTTPTTQGESQGKKIAFSQLAQQGGTYRCTVNQNVGTITTQGTVYLDKALIRGEMKADIGNGKLIDITFIMRDGTTYLWNSMTPGMGFKVKNDTHVQVGSTSAQLSGNIQASSPNAYLENIGDYTCEAWAGDASKFTVPTNITFQAMN